MSSFSKTPWVSKLGGVASEHPVSSGVGVNVLKLGGNAVDAAVAVSLALAVTQPHLGGLGSDLVALIYNGDEVKVLNATGWAPAKLTRGLLESRGLSKVPLRGPLSPVVPGMLAGLYTMWREMGTLEWRSIVNTVIEAVKDGFPAGLSLVRAIRSVISNELIDDAFKSTYPINAEPWSVVKISKLTKALELIAEHGADSMYNGELGESLVKRVNELGGVLDLSDLRDYRPEWVNPVSIEYRGFIINEAPPNTQGLTTLMILKLLEDEDMPKDPFSSERIRQFLNAYRIAYKARDEFIGDPRFTNIPINTLLDVGFLRSLGQGKSPSGVGDTTYFITADNHGNVVSCIQSLYHHFGSLVTDPEYGVTLNNRASDFALSGPNALEPRKRPLHTLSSVMILKNGELKYTLGTSGAHFRPQQHALMITNIIDYGMNPVDAVNAPRFLWNSDELIIEDDYETSGVNEKFRLIKYPGSTGVASVLAMLDNGFKLLYSDIRGDGLALGL
ncbi:gamma-glutamyltransferase family protein [Caldivirga maquilingensis]|uniref:Gamma-glutamyltransferase n=1 Tax=Caldivirga maquilingensis (strain ATCC 700844 / DSM 13496 / JCM 10307 / IC-167) TaxID=397948 RepID=A8ME92_CALMQ|nr:gamma-glutamyltransferase family protein [Caldivirga maquilingensis]ABW02098.1 Gamma-glutamyltransferase [Caldivirga maquilingensis IC-167]